jgi:plastocyanin
MPRPTRRLMLCVLLAVCAGTVLHAADKAKDAKDTKEDEKTPTTKRAGKSHTVKIKDNKYAPAALTIKVGDTVVFKNDDDRDHTAIADDKMFKSDNISPGDTFEFTFKKAGTIKFACKYHPREKGMITVEK